MKYYNTPCGCSGIIDGDTVIEAYCGTNSGCAGGQDCEGCPLAELTYVRAVIFVNGWDEAEELVAL